MIKFKDFYVSDSDYEEQMELFQNEHPNAEFIQITGGHMSPERIWFKYDDELNEQTKLSIPKKLATAVEFLKRELGAMEYVMVDEDIKGTYSERIATESAARIKKALAEIGGEDE